MATYIDW